MGFLKKIWNLIKSGVKKIADLFKDKSPAQIVNDVTKIAVGIATVAVVVHIGFNIIRSFITRRSEAKTNKESRSGIDLMLEKRKPGTIEEKLAEASNISNTYYGKYAGMNKMDIAILEEVSRTRNAAFKILPPAQQMNLLRVEGFDFKQAKEDYIRKHSSCIRKSRRRIGEKSPANAAFREAVDYGPFNFIARPLDDFICWMNNDPTPKKPPQIKVVDREEIPDIEVSSPEELIETLNEVEPYLKGGANMFDDNENLEQLMLDKINAEEIFKHKNIKDFRKAVRNRMAASENGLSSQLFDLMDDEMKRDKKKKKKSKSKKKKFDKKSSDGFYGGFSSGKKKKKSGKKDDYVAESDREAAKIFNHFLKGAMRGECLQKAHKSIENIFDE